MKPVSLLALALLAALPAQATTVLIDFGRHDGGTHGDVVSNPTQPDGSTDVYWNSIGQSTQDQVSFGFPSIDPSYTGFVDRDGAAVAGWTVADLTSNALDGNGYNNGGLSSDASHGTAQDPTFALLGDFAVKEVTGDYWFTGAGSVGFTISGLDDTKTYDFTFFASRVGTSEIRGTTYTLFGLGIPVSSAELLTTGTGIGAGGYDGNNDTTVSVTGITPNSGAIDLAFEATTGGFGYLSAVQITEVPEPGVSLLGAIGLITLMGRRRRH